MVDGLAIFENYFFRKKSSFLPNPAGPDQIEGKVPGLPEGIYYIDQGVI
jgi:hypothetical protein